MGYKRKALKLSEIPEKETKKKGFCSRWAENILDDFWNCDDEAWQITEDYNGNKVTPENVSKLALIFRNAAKRKASNNEFDGEIIVTVRNKNLYIYAKEN